MATVTVLTLDFRTGLFDGLSGVTSQVVGVFQTGVRTVARPFEVAAESVRDLGGLREENSALRDENRELRSRLRAVEHLVEQNARMRELLQIESTTDLEMVRARVIGASLSGSERSALLDKGRGSGIVTDTGVLAPEGLAGRVIWVGPRTAKVLLVTDPQSSIGVKIGETGETGIVAGTGRGDMRLELVSRSALDQGAVKRGDVVLTSGHQGGIFPSGIPIGRVEEVRLASRGTAYTIRVTPYARLSRLDIVSVILRADPVVGDDTVEP